jgi:hypothetical protein
MLGTRTRSGCLTCRRRKKRCDEVKPICQRCQVSGASCVYPDASGFRSERFIISLALDHYILPNASAERHFVNTHPKEVARLCLSYNELSIQSFATNLSTFGEISRPLSGSDALVNVSERHLLQYCMYTGIQTYSGRLISSIDSEVISASRVYVNGNANPFRSLIMPFACTRRGPLLSTILALSANEMASSDYGQHFRLVSNAAIYYENAINQLQQSLENACDAEENLLTCVLLSSFEITNGSRPAWLQHLNGAVAIHDHFASSISRDAALFAYQYFSSRWILLETTMPPGTYPWEEVMAEHSMTSQLLRNINSMLEQTVDTVPTVAMQNIDNNIGCSLEYIHTINRISTLSAIKFHCQADKGATKETHELYFTTAMAFDDALEEMVFVTSSQDTYIEQSSRCFKLAARVYLRLICFDINLTHSTLIQMQNDLVQALRVVINEDQQRRAFPMWPLFIAGCASWEDEHRKIVLDMFRTLERKWPIGNIILVRNVTTQIWQSRDLNGYDNISRRHDWQTLITTFGWKLALS